MSTTITPAKSAKFTPTILQRQPLGDSSSDPQKPTELSKVQTVEVAELVTGTKSEVSQQTVYVSLREWHINSTPA